ncbi:AraC family transcriptional regulator [Pseudomaricurvus alkylphenolicus]|uniref:AraC family transcriptional regulator n=1 Tax=Pseudomaricurvus alkylphenolicus TaxID=1306991 RepID=UPI00142188E7|nr:AraC family transcriptional regulator [Pseudomaricurvus alkylphenolicus]NIB38917.1 AraC family transcriptional regulator [Pseudomaricurvus alkylphenolicus]
MTIVTVAPIFVQRLLEGAATQGHSPEDLLEQQGLSPLLLTNPRFRISTVDFARLCQSIAGLLGDESYGLLRDPMPIGSFGLMFQACHSANTLAESLGILKSAVNLIQGGLAAELYVSADEIVFALQAHEVGGTDNHYMIEQTLAIFHRFLCWQAKDLIPLKGVSLSFPEPFYSEEYRLLYYGARVNFDCSRNQIRFDSSLMEKSCSRTNTELAGLLEDAFPSFISRPRQGQTTATRVRLLLENIFRDGHGSSDMKDIADQLGIADYTLRRKLKAEGYRFQTLRDDIRRDMAIFHLNRKQDSVEEISFKLGFSDSSVFIRAFKGWMGVTPLAYRKLL